MNIDAVYHADCGAISVNLIGKVNLLYADILYDDWYDVPYIPLINTLIPGGALWLQTDQRSVADVKIRLDGLEELKFVNWIIWGYDWGGRPANAFGRKHDDILYYVRNGSQHTFNVDAVSIPKVALINSAKAMKIPTDVWQGNFYTTSKERIKDPETTRGFKWQKPEWLLERIILATSNPGDLVFEPYLGTGTACAVAKRLGRHWIGCDTNKRMVDVSLNRLAAVSSSRSN